MSLLPLSPCLISIKHSAGPIGSNFKTREHCQHLTKWRGGNRCTSPNVQEKERNKSKVLLWVGKNSFHNTNSAFSQKSSPSSLPVPLFFFSSFKNLFIYFWLHWVFVAAHGLSLAAASGDYPSLQFVGFYCGGFCSCGSWALERRLSSCGAQA